jgi:hypothetical protein
LISFHCSGPLQTFSIYLKMSRQALTMWLAFM